MKFMGMLAAMAILIFSIEINAYACYSGLLLIPTTDIIQKGGYGIETQIDGSFKDGSSDTQILNTEVGLSDKLESGIDFDLSKDAETALLLNAKYKFINENNKLPSAAIGTCNIGKSQKHTPYLVFTRSFNSLHGHAGMMRIDGKNRVFIGIDAPVTDRLTLMADYTNGSGNASSFGANYQINDSFGVMGGMIFPNTSGEDVGFSLHLVLNGNFSKSKEHK